MSLLCALGRAEPNLKHESMRVDREVLTLERPPRIPAKRNRKHPESFRVENPRPWHHQPAKELLRQPSQYCHLRAVSGLVPALPERSACTLGLQSWLQVGSTRVLLLSIHRPGPSCGKPRLLCAVDEGGN